MSHNIYHMYPQEKLVIVNLFEIQDKNLVPVPE